MKSETKSKMKSKMQAKASTRIDAMIIAESKKKEWLTPILLLLPSFIMLIIMVWYPFGKTILNTVSTTTPQGVFIKWAGLANWKRALTHPSFGVYMKNTFLLAAMSLPMTFIPAMLLGLLAAYKGKGERFIQTLYVLPMAFSTAPLAAIWIFLFRQESGLLNQLLGTHIAWIRDPEWGLFSIALASSWARIAGATLYLLVGFKGVSDEILEAAQIDGAGWWTRTFKIVMPLASPQTYYVLFLQVINALKTFATIDLLTGGGPAGTTTTIMYSVYEKGTIGGQVEVASCLALVVFVIIFIITRIQLKLEHKFVFYQ